MFNYQCLIIRRNSDAEIVRCGNPLCPHLFPYIFLMVLIEELCFKNGSVLSLVFISLTHMTLCLNCQVID